MKIVNVRQASESLSELLADVEAGEEFVIARDDKPIARVVPVDAAPAKPRGYGLLSHLQGKIPDSFFFDPLPADEQKRWDGAD